MHQPHTVACSLDDVLARAVELRVACVDLHCCTLNVQLLQIQQQQQEQQDGQQAPVSPASSVATVHRLPAPTGNGGDMMDEDADDCQIIDPRDMQQHSSASSSSSSTTPGSAKAAAAPQALFLPTTAAGPAAAAAAGATTAPMAAHPAAAAAAAAAAPAPARHQLDSLVSCTAHAHERYHLLYCACNMYPDYILLVLFDTVHAFFFALLALLQRVHVAAVGNSPEVAVVEACKVRGQRSDRWRCYCYWSAAADQCAAARSSEHWRAAQAVQPSRWH
jgi:hypothetical protein